MSNINTEKSNTYKGEILSFLDLLEKHYVEIPIIQRDYAQGRKDKEEIRLKFLEALYLAIEENKSIKLDFIYGSDVDGIFQPLDGQQRLTTLFLLHWYAATKSDFSNNNVLSILSKFSYETRITSRDFCKALIENKIEINKDSILSTQIIDSSWFYLSWKKDPTIDSMLRTIDDIHKLFFNIHNLLEKLTSNNESRIISFHYVELKDIGLTDDLYIKMNARGKLLSPFENFKASFQKYINDNKWEINVQPNNTFIFKVDTIWTDYFWEYFRRNDSIDEALVKFISTIAMIRQAIDKADGRYKIIEDLQGDSTLVRPKLFNEDGFKYLIQCFDIYKNAIEKNIDLELKFPLWRHKPEKNMLSQIVLDYNISGQTHNASYTQKVLFYAQTEYLKRVDNFEQDTFNDWMRVIRNIVSRGNIEKTGNRPDIIRSFQTFDGVISLVSELAEGCNNIYDFLSRKDKINSSFAKDQVDEERFKAKLISNHKAPKQIIFEMEDNDLFMGRIDFALYCIGNDREENEFNLNDFQKVLTVISKYFKNETEITNDLRRALLTIEHNDTYEYYAYWWSFWNVVSANKRCLINSFRELEYYIYSEYRIYLKKLVLQLMEFDLVEIISNFTPPVNMPNWKVRLIKEKDLLDKKSKSNYIAIPTDESCCYLLKSKRPRDIDGCVEIA